jgi:hypothetical protein
MDLRNETTKYEAISLALVEPDPPNRGTVIPSFPPHGSPLSISGFFAKLYRAYDLRYVYTAPQLESLTARLIWDENSPALSKLPEVDYSPRVGRD